MGREIEIKIPLTSKEFDMLYDFLCFKRFIDGIEILGDDKNPCERRFFLKKDEYYSRYKKEIERKENNEPQVIRIRTQEFENERRSYFTIKRKVVKMLRFLEIFLLLQVIQNGFPKKKKLVVFTASFLRLKEFHFIWNLKLSMN